LRIFEGDCLLCSAMFISWGSFEGSFRIIIQRILLNLIQDLLQDFSIFSSVFSELRIQDPTKIHSRSYLGSWQE
jgi:hypothetical protein